MALSSRQEALVASLRRYGGLNAVLMRDFADKMALNTTDAAALAEILAAQDAGSPLTPAALATRIGRSRPATSAVLNRLEQAGLIRRDAHPEDRRATILGAAEAIHLAAAGHFQTLSDEVERRLAGFPPGDMAAAIRVIDEMSAAISIATRK